MNLCTVSFTAKNAFAIFFPITMSTPLDAEELDIDTNAEEEDELASAGLHVVSGEEGVDDLEDEAASVVPIVVAESAEDEKPKSGLEELEELEKSLLEEKEGTIGFPEEGEDEY